MRCVLHIGAEKTGSTAIQTWLSGNQSQLEAHGVFQSRVMLPGVNRELAACFQDDLDDLHAANDIFDEEQRRAVCVPFLERLSAEIRDESSRFDRMIVSSEHFHSRFRSEKSISALAGFLNAHFTSIRVVCYLREQSDALLS